MGCGNHLAELSQGVLLESSTKKHEPWANNQIIYQQMVEKHTKGKKKRKDLVKEKKFE
jgi:hypothetical protein